MIRRMLSMRGSQVSRNVAQSNTVSLPSIILGAALGPLERKPSLTAGRGLQLCGWITKPCCHRAAESRFFGWCARVESNHHSFRNTDLNRARLPIPPRAPVELPGIEPAIQRAGDRPTLTQCQRLRLWKAAGLAQRLR